MTFKLKVIFLKFLNKLLNPINLTLDLSIKKNQIIKTLNKLKPYDLGYDLIRVGSSNDGGYLLPNIFNEIEICFSPGTGQNTEFEKDILKKDIKTFLADGTINEKDINLKNFHFTKKNLASFESEKTITLENWINSHAKDKSNLLLQMDIESSEYEVIQATKQDCLKQFKIIIIEFHYLEKINNYFFYQVFNNTIDKLLLNFEISHVHSNNCQGSYSVNGIDLPTAIEVTFLRKDLCKYKKNINTKIHKLDQKNIAHLSDVFLPKEILKN
tara:strand:- start:3110 stop:3919 length:810 start_codon:yes stop_codon:yes gene_type:complete